MMISMIAAMDRNRLIGNNNQLPWHLPADFAHFKAVTMGKPIVMGRKTFDSIGKPLPGRMNIVLSRQVDLEIDGVICVNSFEQAVQAAEGADEIMVIGGSTIYEMLMPRCDRLYITHVQATFEGDAWFPDIDEAWRKVDSRPCPADEANRYDCEYAIYER